MVSSSRTSEIVEESDSVPRLKETKFRTGGSISNHKYKVPSTTGRKFSLEDDLNHIFEAIDLRVSTRGLGLSHRSHTSPKVASKNPIRVGVSQASGIGISESVTLKQALRKISVSNASEIAAKKRLLKSIASSEVSKAGTIKRLYRAVVVEASESGIHVDEEKGSSIEVPIVPDEITPDSSYDLPPLLAEAGNKTSTVNLGQKVKLRSTLSLSSSETPMNASEVDQDGSVSLDFVSGTSTLDPYPNVKLHCLPSLSSSDTSNKVSKSTTNSPSLLKPIFGSNCFYKKKVKQNLASVISTSYPCIEDDKFGLNPCTSKLACKSHSCSQQDREESISPAPSSTSLIVEGCSSNVDSVANKPDIMSNSCMDRTSDAEASKSSRSREKGDSSQSSKSSIGECSGTSGEETNSSRSSYLSTRPHMSKNLRWDVIHNIEIQHGTLGLRHFKLLKRLGCGDIGTVYLAELTGTSNLFAVKVMDTKFLASRKKMLRALTERDILQMLDHPFLPTLFANFVTDKFLCLVMEYCPGGDLHILRQRQPGGNFSEKAVRFYVAEVLLALEYLHMLGIVYRDLKPENILVREDGHIMLSDFDLSLRCTVRPTLLKTSSAMEQTRKVSGPCMESSCIHPFCLQPSCVPVRCFTLKSTAPKTQKLKSVPPVHFPQLVAEPTNARSNSFVGTHEYLAPEIIKGEGHGNAVDWWTFGIFLYELLYGKTPFKGLGNEDTLVNVVLHSLKFPTSPSVSSQARDLIRGLLIKDPEIRLGSVRGAAEIRQHPFFEGLNWALIRCAVPPILPKPKFLYPGLSQVCEEKPVEFLSSKEQPQFDQF